MATANNVNIHFILLLYIKYTSVSLAMLQWLNENNYFNFHHFKIKNQIYLSPKLESNRKVFMRLTQGILRLLLGRYGGWLLSLLCKSLSSSGISICRELYRFRGSVKGIDFCSLGTPLSVSLGKTRLSSCDFIMWRTYKVLLATLCKLWFCLIRRYRSSPFLRTWLFSLMLRMWLVKFSNPRV